LNEHLLKSIDFTSPGVGLSPHSPPEYVLEYFYLRRAIHCSVVKSHPCKEREETETRAWENGNPGTELKSKLENLK